MSLFVKINTQWYIMSTELELLFCVMFHRRRSINFTMILNHMKNSLAAARASGPQSQFLSMVVPLATGLAIALGLQTAAAREIHVATTGSDSNPGGKDNPYLTIGKAASVAQPGDMVIVHTGTYREWVKPARGGTSEDQRITYRAAADEEVLVKGSLRVTS